MVYPRPYLRVVPERARVVFVGQDPTVANVARRKEVETVLDLDHPGRLWQYVEGICHDLGCTMDEVYATNACTNFFVDRPTDIIKRDNVDVLKESAALWLPVLQKELARFPKAVVVSLGQPVLSMLVRAGSPCRMGHYWGYHRAWRTAPPLTQSSISATVSMLGRQIFPFVHQPTLRGRGSEFYRQVRPGYVQLIRTALGGQRPPSR